MSNASMHTLLAHQKTSLADYRPVRVQLINVFVDHLIIGHFACFAHRTYRLHQEFDESMNKAKLFILQFINYILVKIQLTLAFFSGCVRTFPIFKLTAKFIASQTVTNDWRTWSCIMYAVWRRNNLRSRGRPLIVILPLSEFFLQNNLKKSKKVRNILLFAVLLHFNKNTLNSNWPFLHSSKPSSFFRCQQRLSFSILLNENNNIAFRTNSLVPFSLIDQRTTPILANVKSMFVHRNKWCRVVNISTQIYVSWTIVNKCAIFNNKLRLSVKVHLSHSMLYSFCLAEYYWTYV